MPASPRRHRLEAVPALDSPAAVLPGALRLPRGHAAGRRGRERAHARAAVPLPPAGGGSGAGGRGARRGRSADRRLLGAVPLPTRADFSGRLEPSGRGGRVSRAWTPSMVPHVGRRSACDNPGVADGTARMVFLGFGKYARADKIYALEPIRGNDRRRRQADARLGGRDRRADRRRPHRADDPARDGAGRRRRLEAPGRRAGLRRAHRRGRRQGPRRPGRPRRRARKLLEASAKPAEAEQLF